MKPALQCPECGTSVSNDAPSGLCPQCLVRQGLEILAEDDSALQGGQTRVVAGPPRRAASSITPQQRFGDYELGAKLGQGGMGVVYQARQVSLGRLVALKMIRSGQLATPAEVQRFRTEAAAAAKLDHPHIVPIYDIGEQEGQYYFTMRLVEGSRLSDEIGGKPLDLARAAQLTAKVARAVHFAHQRGVLHRDLKPSNILLDQDGEPQLTDFGLAKIVERDSSLTQSAAVLGTANYMAPEQAGGKARELTTAVDVYGLGATFYEMLTGKPPFQAEAIIDTLRQVIEKEPARPSSLNAAVDRDLETICLKCLEKSPEHRYASAEAIAQDLERWAAGEPILARPATTWERTIKWAKRKPAVAALAGSVLVVGAAGLIGVIWQWRIAEDARRGVENHARALRRNLYVADLNLAQRALQDNNLGRAVALIQKYFPRPGDEDLRGFEWRFLWKEARGDEAYTFDHEHYVNTVAFSPDGRFLVAGGHENHLSVWDVTTRRLATKLRLYDEWPSGGPILAWGALQFSPDGRFLLAKAGTNVVIWDAATWDELARRTGLSVPMLFLPGGKTAVTSAGSSSKPAFWNTVDWSRRPAEAGQFTNLYAPYVCSRDGRFAVAYSRTLRQVQIWDVAAGRMRSTFKLPSESYQSWALSPDGEYLATGTWIGKIGLWDCQRGEPRAMWGAHSSQLHGLAFSPDGRTLASAGHDQVIRLWDVATTNQTAVFKGHLNEVWTVAYSPDGKMLATGGKDALVKLWNSSLPPEVTSLKNALKPVCFAEHGRQLICIKAAGVVAAWDTRTCQELGSVAPGELTPSTEPLCGQASPDGEVVAVGTRTGQIYARLGKTVKTFQAHSQPVFWLRLSADKRLLATGSPEALRIWDLATVRQMTEFGPIDTPVAFSPDGTRVAIPGANFSMTLWDVATRQVIATLEAHKWTVWSAEFSPDSSLLLLTSIEGTCSLWNARSGKFIAMLRGHREGVSSGCFSPDGKTIATVSTDETVRLWSVATHQELLTITGYGDDIGSVMFSPDGQTLAVGMMDPYPNCRPVRLWRVPSLAEIDALPRTAAAQR